MLKGSESDITHLDVDALILENKFLMEQTSNLENELEHAKQSASKLKVIYFSKKSFEELTKTILYF